MSPGRRHEARGSRPNALFSFSFRSIFLSPTRRATINLEGMAELSLNCAHRASTFKSCALCEQSSLILHPPLNGQGFILDGRAGAGQLGASGEHSFIVCALRPTEPGPAIPSPKTFTPLNAAYLLRAQLRRLARGHHCGSCPFSLPLSPTTDKSVFTGCGR